MGRAPCCDKANVKKGPWSPEEDAKLKAYIEKNGTGGNWIALPQKIGLKRCGKSCRLRWLNYLRPNIKHGGFTEEEDNIICSLYISIGSRWSIIAAQLPGRTDNDIKNYWNTRLKKKLLGRRKQSNMNRLSAAQDQKDADVAEENPHYLQNLSSSALERLQLHMQLQSLQNPFSFYNNPALWPKLNPLQEKMLQILQHSNESQNAPMQQVPSTHRPGLGQNLELLEPNFELLEQANAPAADKFGQDYSKMSSLKGDVHKNSINGISSSDSSIPLVPGRNDLDSTVAPKSNVTEPLESGIHQTTISTFTQAEIENFLNSKSAGFLSSGSPMVDFDCLKEIDGSRDNLVWWCNDIDTNSASSNSWDSTSLLHQSDGIYQDYGLGYSM